MAFPPACYPHGAKHLSEPPVAELNITWTLSGFTPSSIETVEFLLNGDLLETKTPDGLGEIIFTESIPVGANVTLRCILTLNNDTDLTGITAGSSDLTFSSVTYPSTNGPVVFTPWDVVYTNITAGTEDHLTFAFFNAAGLSDLVSNLDASSLGLNNGDLASTWTNKTGGVSGTQTGTARATFNTSAINGLPALTFGGAQYYDQVLSGYTGGNYTVFFVCNLTSGSSGSHRGLMFGSGLSPYLTLFDSPPKIYGYNGTILPSTPPQLLTRTMVVGMRVSSSPSKKELFYNRTIIATDAVGNTNLNVLSISHPTYPWVGKMGQVLMVSRKLNDTEALQTIEMLEAKWGCANRVIACDGDSLTRGYGVSAAQAYPAVMQGSLGTNYDVRNFGVDSQTLATMITTAAAQIDTPFGAVLGSKKNGVVCFAGTNDLYFGASAATTITRFQTYCAARRSAGLKVIACTIIDHAEPSGSWTAADALTVNNSIRANYATYADVLCDLAADSRLANHADTTYFNADGVHLTAAGYAVVASLVQSAVNTL